MTAVVKVRLSGAADDVAAAAALLSRCGQVLDQSHQYQNRREPDVRVYLTLVCPPGMARS